MTDIIEGNRLIAEFDGYDIHMNGYQYHSSWDWLMPVVEKIHLLREVTEFSIRPGSTRIWLKKGSFIQSPINPHNDSITECWLAVVEFIHWWNKNNEKTKP